jgi:hypothetical protein
MDTADFDIADFDPRAREADKALFVRFYTQPIKNEEKSVLEGRPIYDDAEMIEIRVRGEKDNIVLREARPDDHVRFSEAHKFFREGKSLSDSGTPLSAWPSMSSAQVEELKYFKFFTVEDLAHAPESALGKFPGLRGLRDRAVTFLEAAKGNAPLEKMNKELEDKQNQIDTMQKQLEAVNEQMAKLAAQLEKKK